MNGFVEEKKNEISLNEETNEFEFIYKEINNEEFNKKFQEKLREEITKINENLDISNKLYNAIIVKSKLEIYSFILDEVLNIIINSNKNDVIININSLSKVLNLVKDKLKYNQNILFDFVMNNNTNNDNYIKNNDIKLNLNTENPMYVISDEISIIDSLSTDKIKIIQKRNLISLLDQIYEYKIKHNLDYNEAIIPFLTAKYGMKSLANFWHNKIIEGINYHFVKEKYIKLDISKLYFIAPINDTDFPIPANP